MRNWRYFGGDTRPFKQFLKKKHEFSDENVPTLPVLMEAGERWLFGWLLTRLWPVSTWLPGPGPGCRGDMGSDLTMARPGLTLCLEWGGLVPDTDNCGMLKQYISKVLFFAGKNNQMFSFRVSSIMSYLTRGNQIFLNCISMWLISQSNQILK